MTDRTIKAALVGAGYIADWHADAIRATNGVDLAAIVDVSRPAAEALANNHGAAAFTSLDDLIAANICDAVHILTPPHLHRDLAIQAFQAGLHCFVEKPVALSGQDTDQMRLAADTAGRVFGVGHNFMGMPGYQRLKAARASGQLGKITSAEINWHFPLAPLRAGPFGLWLLADRNNLLLELGPHLYAFAIDLFGPLEIEHVSLGKPITLPGNGGTRPQSWRIIGRAGDVDVTITLSLVETVDDRSVTLRGSGGMARFDYAADTLTISGENASDIVLNPLRRQLADGWQHLREGTVNVTRQLVSLNLKSPYGLSFAGAVGAFYEAVRNGQPIDARFSGVSGVAVMTAIDETLALLPAEAPPAPVKPKRAPKPTALVIGGTGFIGRYLTRTLVARGLDVRVLSRGKSGPFGDLPEQVDIMSASLTDADGLARAMDGIEVVYHLGKSLDGTWEDCLKNDVGVTVGIARAALAAGVRRFVYTGTIASYDMSDPNQIITEDTGFADDMTDRNLYARSKAECEHQLLNLQQANGLPLVIARPGIVVGEGGPLQHWGIGRWHGAGAVRIWGPGKNILPFVLAQDVAEALVRMIEVDDAVGQSFNLIGKPMMTARDYFDAIQNQMGARITVNSGNLGVFFAAASVKHGLKKYVLRKKGLSNPSFSDWKSRAHFSPFDNSRAKKLLGWAPEPSKAGFIDAAITKANLFGF